jgi:hypothetical protein
MTHKRDRWHLWAKSAQMQKVGYALPATGSTGNDGMLRKGRLSKRLDQKPCLLQREKIGFQRAMLTVESHRQTVALDRVSVLERTKIVPLDDQASVNACLFEAPGGVDRMNNRQTKSAARLQNTRCFTDGSRHIADILK